MSNNFAIVIIATGKYKLFLEPLIKSLDIHFNPPKGKKYFLFTDEKCEWFDNHNLIKWIKIENYNNPSLVAIKKFEYIQRSLTELKEFDYIFYIDSDMELVSELTEDMIDLKDKKYFSVGHWCTIKNPNFWTVEKNPRSTAYLGERNGSTYIHSCIWGTKSTYVQYMIDTLKNNIDEDLKNGIIALWADESHLNRFFVDHKDDIMILNPGFDYPERYENEIPKSIKKIVLHKAKNLNVYSTIDKGSTSKV